MNHEDDFEFERQIREAADKMADAINKMSLMPQGVLSEAREAMTEYRELIEEYED